MRGAVKNFLVNNWSNTDVEQDELNWEGLNSNDAEKDLSTITTTIRLNY